MKTIIMILGILVIGVLIAPKSLAVPQGVVVGTPQYSGTGCPQGAASVVFSPDYSTFTIMFDSFVSQTGGSVTRDLKECSLVIPITLPQGVMMQISQVDFRGFVDLKRGARADLKSSFALSKRLPNGGMTRGIPMGVTNTMFGPSQTDYLVSSKIRDNRNAFPCGGDQFMRVISQISLNGRDSQATLDSIDESGNIVYHVNWTQCLSYR